MLTPALVPTNDRIPIMYITTNSKTIITPQTHHIVVRFTWGLLFHRTFIY
jgi:hypothetical protein